MAKQKLVKCVKEDYHIIETVTDEQIANIITIGNKFYGIDGDLWRVVSTFDDDGMLMIVTKSWAKYKQRWCYHVDDIFSFIFTLGLKEQLYKDAEGNFHIKCSKK